MRGAGPCEAGAERGTSGSGGGSGEAERAADKENGCEDGGAFEAVGHRRTEPFVSDVYQVS